MSFNVSNDIEGDDDGHSNNTVNLNIKHGIGESSNIHASALHSKAETEFDNASFDNISDSVQQSYILGFDTRLSNDWATSFDAGQSKDRLDTQSYYEDFFAPGTFIATPSLFETKRDQIRWQNNLSLGETAQLAFGVDYINDRVDSSTTFAETERDNTGVYALLQDKFGKHQLQLSARTDNNEAFGSHQTGNVAWSYDINGEESSYVGDLLTGSADTDVKFSGVYGGITVKF